ncbi:MAG: hypothetical protein ACFFDN_24985 [Candidatus Hodarchaeota archaeon]
MIIYLIFFAIFGGINLFGTEINIIIVLVALGSSCLITLIGIGIFMRLRDRLISFLGSEDNFPSETLAERIVLGIWIAAICFFSIAVFYGFILIYQYLIFPIYGQAVGIIIIFIILAIIIICFILQVFLVIMSRYTKKVVRGVLADK